MDKSVLLNSPQKHNMNAMTNEEQHQTGMHLYGAADVNTNTHMKSTVDIHQHTDNDEYTPLTDVLLQMHSVAATTVQLALVAAAKIRLH